MRLAVIPARGGSKRIPRKNIRPFGGRKILFIWDRIAEDIGKPSAAGGAAAIPMANGGVLHG